MKHILSIVVAALAATTVNAETKDVTSKYIENPSFEARFAAWENAGSFTYNTSNNFDKRSGDIWLEKWVSSGSQLGTRSGIYQTLRNMEDGTYTLVAAAKNVSQASSTTICKGAYLYAGVEEIEFNKSDDYTLVFTVSGGKTDIGVRLSGCDGNWVGIDNFRLYYNGINADSLQAEKTRLEQEHNDFLSKLENPTGKIPTVTTNPFVAMGTTIALGRATFSANGATFKERGFCWSENPEPTIHDERSTLFYENNGNIYHMDGLKPGTIYYVRAYAITSGYQVAYGEVVKIATLPKGTVAYSYDFAGDAETNARINSATAETVWMYNNLSNINGFYLQVHYVPGSGSGGGTADCSYGGWMRVSQTQSYQQTGTILHETNHGVGVGTTWQWYDNEVLRENTTRGYWLGPRATEMVRFFDNNNTSKLNGDGTHMWPYGINGAHEDSYQPSKKVLYYANILVTHALHQDGLVCSSGVGFATPSYTFQQDDNKKYYIKIEDVEKGLGTKYLTIEGNSLVLKTAKAEEAKADDSYAWNITYDASTSLYSFYNVGEKKYISGTFATAANNTSGKYQVMPSRIKATFKGSDGYSFTGQSYWILKPNKSYSPTAFGVRTDKPGTISFDFENDATSQRWLFLDENQIEEIEDVASHTDMSSLIELIGKARSLLATSHLEDSVGADEAFESVIEEVEASVSTLVTPEDLTNAKQKIIEAVPYFLIRTTPDKATPYDVTFLITNPTVSTSCEGWSEEGTVNYGCVEFFEKNFDFNQTLSVQMPTMCTFVGRLQGFQRPGSSADTKTIFPEGSEANKSTNAKLYINSKNRAIDNIWYDAQTESLGTGSICIDGLYVPNNMSSASKWFDAGYYESYVIYSNSRAKTMQDMKIGINVTASNTNYWNCFRNFRLYCYGRQSITDDDVTSIESVTDNEAGNSLIFDLTGRQISTPSKGLYIQNGKKILKW